jgi:adenosylmethionine-8-amino-7-oxononanoate aminotransferase
MAVRSEDLAGQSKRIFIDFVQMKSFAESPMILADGDGIHVTDVDGKRYMDGLSGVMVCNLGYGNERIINAISEQLRRLQFSMPMYATNELALELSRQMADITPAQYNTVKFLSGGSEATEASMKMARQYHRQTGHPNKYKIISRYWAYHGGTMGALAASGGASRKQFYEPYATGYVHVPPPFCYRCPYGLERPACGIACAKAVEEFMKGEGPETVAAIIAEPVIVSGDGFVVPPDEYFPILRDICDRYNVLLILDEIITGLGRLGAMWGAETVGAWPDIFAAGKGMSAGYYPLSVVVLSDTVAEAFWGDPEEDVQFHAGHTYGSNPVAGAAGIAAIGELVENDFPNRVRELGEHMMGRLETLKEEHQVVGQITGKGLLIGIEYVQDRDTHEPFPEELAFAKKVDLACRERGLVTRPSTHVQVLAPPFISTREQLDEMVSIIDDAIAAATRAHAPALAGAG